jgi:TRAP transporter TAXI family solute receptor
MSIHLFKRVFIIGGTFLVLLVASFALRFYYLQYRKVEFKLCTGRKSGEGYYLARALAEVAKKHYSYKIRKLQLLETPGSEANLDSIRLNKADLALVQADMEHFPENSRVIAILYPDFFQLIARKNAGIKSFAELKGKRVALPESGSGQYTSFWFLAEYYGIHHADIKEVHASPEKIAQFLLNDSIDATFVVRALGNQYVKSLLKAGKSELVAIPDGEAIQLSKPALHAALVPRGAYGGNPCLPENNLWSVAAPRLLIAREDADAEGIRTLTQLLFERRTDLSRFLGPNYRHLVGAVSQPGLREGTLIPIHAGAKAFFESTKPSFLSENAELLGIFISILLPLISGIAGWYASQVEEQKDKADTYAKEVMHILNALQHPQDADFLSQKRTELVGILNRVMADLDNDILTIEGFHLFSFTWETTYKALREKEIQLAQPIKA